MERVFTESEVLAALRQAREDFAIIPEGEGIGRVTDKERLTAYVALAECAEYLGLSVDEVESPKYKVN